MKRFIKFGLGFLCLLVSTNFASAQAGDYSLTISNGNTFSPLGPSATNVPSIEADGGTAIVGIGFDFFFEGIAYDTIAASPNGFISFNPGSPTNHGNDLDGIGATSRPLVAPLWDDLDGSAPNAASKANFELSGVAPNRVFTFEWLNYEWNWLSSDSTVSFQVKLYETSNEIEFIYDNNLKTPNSPTASIGLTGLNTFLSLSGINSGSVTTSNQVETANIDSVVTGQLFRFTPPSCPSPTFISFSQITGDSLTINWAGQGAGPWYVNWGPAGFTQGSPTTNYDTTNVGTLRVGDLNFGTTYEFYISEYCGPANQSNWSGPYAGTTVYAPPYLEDYIGGYPGADFSEARGFIGEPSNITGTSSAWTEDGMSNNGTTGAAKINIYGTGVQEWMFSPRIDLGNGSISYQVEFDAALTPWNGTTTASMGADDTVRLVISTDGGATWNRSNTLVELSSADNIPNGNGQHYVADLSAYSGIVMFGFYAESTVSNADNDFFVDNFQVRVPPACAVPTLISTPIIGSDSVLVNWVSSEAAFNLEYGPAPYSQGGGGTSISVTDTFLVINGLNPNTVYEFYLQSDCSSNGGGFSVFSSVQSFKTNCAPFTAPYTEDFDGTSWAAITTYDPCWTVNPNSGFRWQVETGTTTSGNTGPDNDFSGSGNYVYTEATTGSNGDSAYILSPSVDISPLSSPYLTFRYHMYGSDMGKLDVDFWDGQAWQDAVWSISGQQHSSGASTWSEAAVNIDNLSRTSDTIQIRFRGIRGPDFRSDIAIDQFVLGEAPACPSPLFDSISEISPFTAIINWTSYSGNSNIEWGPIGFTQGTGTGNLIFNTSPSDTLTGLLANTCYDVYIQDTCGVDGSSDWIGPFTFCTPVTCQAPTNLGIDPSLLTTNSASLIWTGGGAAFFELEYGLAGFTPNTGVGTQLIASNDTLAISSLSGGTAYDFYVRDSCGLGDVSTLSGPFTFITAFTTNYLNDFDLSAIPFAWLEADGKLTSNTVFTSGASSWTFDNFLNIGGGQNGQKANIYTANQFEWLISPSIYLDPSIPNLQVEFDAAVTVWNQSTQGYFGSDDTLALVISTDNGASWDKANALWVADASDTVDAAGEHIVVPLTGYSGYVRFGLYAGSTLDDPNDNDFFIDHFEVRSPANCTSPSAIVVDQIGLDSALVSWTAGDPASQSWSLIYTLGNQAASAGTVLSSNNDSLVLNGLSASTNYCVYIVEQCATGFSDTIGPICFTTQCNSFVAPYFEDFETSTSDCWSQSQITGTKDWTIANGSTGGSIIQAYSGSNNAQFTSSSGGPHVSRFISPVIDVTNLATVELSFWFGQEDWAGDQNYTNVYYRISPNDPWIWAWGDSTNISVWTKDSVIINASSATLQIAFEGIDLYGRANVIDDVKIQDPASVCNAPSNLAAANANCDEIDISWTSDVNATSSTILYGLKGFAPLGGGGTIMAGVSSPLTLSSLSMDEDYDFYVLDSCSGSASPMAGPFSFKTDSIGPLWANFSILQVSPTLTDADVDFDAAASTNVDSYSWDFGNGSTATGVNPTATYTSNGTYDVTLTVTDRCGAVDDTTISVVVGGISIIENQYEAKVQVFPNPSNGVFSVVLNSKNTEYNVEIVDLSGKLVYKREALITGDDHKIDLGDKASGVYTLRITGEGLNITRRLMLN
tara:strand:+ start:73376 stop:78349 length:4974 start_codon:yes stop_codon:yes gene_type:complete